ncbi:MAG: thioredoxin TrxC [Vicinamibacteraceae bacterium]
MTMTDATLIRCPSCGATNRLPADPLGQGKKAVCGRCKTPLSMTAGPTTVSDATFAADVERSPLPVLVDLWAPWCGPCRTVGPIVDELAADFAGRVRVVKMNVDDNPATSARFAVRSIPTLLVFKDGREVDRLVGAQPKATIAGRLARVL